MLEWISTNAEAITAISTTCGLLSLYLIYKQLKDARIWNKLHFTYTFFPDSLEFEELEIFLDERISFWKRDSALTDTEVKALIGKESLTEDELKLLSNAFGPTAKKENAAQELYEAGRKLKLYMNQIEYYCAAISAGIVDAESAKNIYSYKFKRAYEKALPWIKEIRQMKHEPAIYIEISKTLTLWHPEPNGQTGKY